VPKGPKSGRTSFKTRKGLVQGKRNLKHAIYHLGLATKQNFNILFPWTSPLRVLKEVRPLRVFKEARPDFGPFGTECGIFFNLHF
jgi:hypothetical protein